MTHKEYRNGTWYMTIVSIILLFGYFTPFFYLGFLIYYAQTGSMEMLYVIGFVIFAICSFVMVLNGHKKQEYVESSYKNLVRNVSIYKNNPDELEIIINKEKEHWLYRHIEWNE